MLRKSSHSLHAFSFHLEFVAHTPFLCLNYIFISCNQRVARVLPPTLESHNENRRCIRNLWELEYFSWYRSHFFLWRCGEFSSDQLWIAFYLFFMLTNFPLLFPFFYYSCERISWQEQHMELTVLEVQSLSSLVQAHLQFRVECNWNSRCEFVRSIRPIWCNHALHRRCQEGYKFNHNIDWQEPR